MEPVLRGAALGILCAMDGWCGRVGGCGGMVDGDGGSFVDFSRASSEAWRIKPITLSWRITRSRVNSIFLFEIVRELSESLPIILSIILCEVSKGHRPFATSLPDPLPRSFSTLRNRKSPIWLKVFPLECESHNHQ